MSQVVEAESRLTRGVSIPAHLTAGWRPNLRTVSGCIGLPRASTRWGPLRVGNNLITQ